eukprot:TRINITY_DN5848_c0_g1_i1.p1 TRINITY_DN5848_c0_g1~~TRINITY_DN5848_c0_g1_i1.p1  ORF type:complete len:483 (+),score=107.14 TRINITY_DN5848_c0_g1_i1:37-1449(+)
MAGGTTVSGAGTSGTTGGSGGGKRSRQTAAATATSGASALSNHLANGSHADSASAAPPPMLLGPTLQVHNSFADQNSKRIVMALQSGLKSELTWALNTLTLLSFKEKEDVRKDATPLAKLPGLLDALLQVVDDWRDIAHPRESAKLARPRLLGANCPYTGFGFEYEITSANDPLSRVRSVSDALMSDDGGASCENRMSDWWYDEDGLFNLDEEGRAERQQCAVAASNVLRNFSFMPENETVMAQHRHCLETIIQCMEDCDTEDEELVTNATETIVNLAPFLNLRIFSSSKPSHAPITEKRAVEAIMRMLESSVKAWHCCAAELIGRLIINPDNEPFVLPFVPQIYRRLVDLLSFPGADAQAAAVAALYNLAEVNMDCRLKLANERWAIGRLLKIIQSPHPLSEVCRKAALTLESLALEPQNRVPLSIYENVFAEIAFSDARLSEIFARILCELTSRANNKTGAVRGAWGM